MARTSSRRHGKSGPHDVIVPGWEDDGWRWRIGARAANEIKSHNQKITRSDTVCREEGSGEVGGEERRGEDGDVQENVNSLSGMHWPVRVIQRRFGEATEAFFAESAAQGASGEGRGRAFASVSAPCPSDCSGWPQWLGGLAVTEHEEEAALAGCIASSLPSGSASRPSSTWASSSRKHEQAWGGVIRSEQSEWGVSKLLPLLFAEEQASPASCMAAPTLGPAVNCFHVRAAVELIAMSDWGEWSQHRPATMAGLGAETLRVQLLSTAGEAAAWRTDAAAVAAAGAADVAVSTSVLFTRAAAKPMRSSWGPGRARCGGLPAAACCLRGRGSRAVKSSGGGGGSAPWDAAGGEQRTTRTCMPQKTRTATAGAPTPNSRTRSCMHKACLLPIPRCSSTLAIPGCQLLLRRSIFTDRAFVGELIGQQLQLFACASATSCLCPRRPQTLSLAALPSTITAVAFLPSLVSTTSLGPVQPPVSCVSARMPTFGGIFTARRKSQGNAFDEEPSPPHLSTTPPDEDRGAFRVLNQAEVERNKQLLAAKRVSEKSKFGRFGGFGASGNKGRNQSFDDDSANSSKRYVGNADQHVAVVTKLCGSDSKSSSGTQFSTSRPYNVNQYGSTSTLPSSANTDTDDNMFNNLPPRPPAASHHGSPHSMSMSALKKQLPHLPKSKTDSALDDQSSRGRAMTGSSYASTAIPPKLDTEMNFGASGFDDLFSGLDRKPSPDFHHESGRSSPGAGRSLLAGKRAFHAEPIRINNQLEVEPPLQSWESRGSGEHLITAPNNGYSPTSPPPVPPHKHTYVPVASHSPELRGGAFEDRDARLVRQSFIERKSFHEGSPEPQQMSASQPSSQLLQTPLASRSAPNIATPKAAVRPAATPLSDDDDENLFAPPTPKDTPVRKAVAQTPKENIPPLPNAPGEPTRRVLTAAEFRAKQEAQMLEPPPESSDDEDDYDDEEDAIKKRQDEELARRKRQQMNLAREHLRRSTTAPADPNRPSSMAGIGNVPPMGFPSETSLQADEWDDEDVPLGILREHGFPGRGKAPQQPSNSQPSYFRSGTPDRPSSAGPSGVRASNGYRPPFARGLPDDPYSNVIGGGLVQPANRESLGFGRSSSAMSLHGGDPGMGGMGMAMGPPMPTMPYHEPNQPYPSLVEQIHMRDITKQKYKGGASSKNPMQQGGPFTGSAMGGQMNAMNQPLHATRMTQMPMQGMGGMNPMMGMMGGQMPMMGMNQMAYPHAQSNDQLMQLQQLVMQQQMQLAQFNQQQQMAAMYGHPSPQPGQPPNQFMNPQQGGFQHPNFANNSFLSVANAGNPQQRPMSIMSTAGPPQQLNRPYSMAQGQGGYPQQQQMGNGMGGMGMGMMGGLAPGGLTPGYTPSIAPSERSNIGLSARYRPVVTGNGISGMDGHSTASSLTLQASGGAPDATKVKGILKKSPSPVADDEDDWGKMKTRKNKFGAKKEESNGALKELVQGVDGY
ncbi:hypothetical protein P154DRAFT_539553 [Amniculicola lignicola CBS 123094]|uniref:Uncharacterized protein n=1 Tax=Amniculicola lignicola CBS 123094 TaxID=1392246 RepID=A0A6A5W5T6_9PLEO|nr:hypothetical protein P154DRAFT_539553 [Amniculicola lignicola CBS 123094]